MLPTLDELGRKHRTDKSSNGHDYLNVYASLLGRYRRKPMRLLEIGVLKGASLRMWRDFFPEGEIVGLDRDPAALAHAGERISVHLADQDDIPGLAALVRNLGRFDVIVEDGSHIWTHQIGTLKALLPLVKPGGYYILEDLHTSYGALAARYGRAGGEPAAGFCYRLAEQVLAQGSIAPDPDPFLAEAPAMVESVTFAKHVAIFRRRR
jgi:predicted O-methyltransferase YrrM